MAEPTLPEVVDPFEAQFKLATKKLKEEKERDIERLGERFLQTLFFAFLFYLFLEA